MKNLIINADDFGLSHGTNAAIIACHQAGSVSSTTLMVNMNATQDAVGMARQTPGLGVGLHFSLTCGRPICNKVEVASLVDKEGLFLPRGGAEKRAVAGQFKAEEIRRELEAQLARFCSFGLTPTHIDSHQHIHIYPAIFDVVAGFCLKQNLPLRVPWVWSPPMGVPLRRHIRMWILKWMVTRNMKRWSGKLKTNASLASIFDLQLKPEDISGESYRTILQFDHVGPLELMVHPANVDEEHGKLTSISSTSAREYEALKFSDLRAVARDLGYEVINYSQL
jgi:predicted glycoside hydrolase/deacetylase ChbG (UPF0249 family)